MNIRYKVSCHNRKGSEGMGGFLTLLQLELTLYILIALGVFLRKKGFLNDENESFLSKLTLNVILPCSIIKSFLIEFNGEILKEFTTVLVIALFAAIFQFASGKLFFRFISEEKRKILAYGVINPNCAFLGIPMIEGAFGEAGLAQASVYMIPNRFFIWTVGLGLFTEKGADRKKVLKKCLMHPCMVALYIGIFFMLTQIQLPVFLTDALRLMSNSMTALSMLLIGSIISKISPGDILNRECLYFCLIRLVVIPGVIFLLCLAGQVSSYITGVCVMMTAMPAASITAVLAKQYHADEKLAGMVVIGSTLLSAVTIPVWLYLVSIFF